MSILKDHDAVIAGWLDEGPTTLPSDTRQAIAVGIRTLPQGHPRIRWPFARPGLPQIDLRRLAVAVGGVAAVVAAAALVVSTYPNLAGFGLPADDPRQPFIGVWISTSDDDGGTQTMRVRAIANSAVDVVTRDDIATVCSQTPSTMTAAGRVDDRIHLVLPTPVYTCDDGSEPALEGGSPLEELLRNFTFVLDPQSDTLSDGFGGIWWREGAKDPRQNNMWPQSTLEEVRQAQELADAGDPAYTWQVEPELEANLADAEIFARFLRDELGWEGFLWNRSAGYEAGDPANNNETFSGLEYLRCAPDRTNPLYPDDRWGGECAPTIDEFRYETVQINVAQLGRRGSSGIWVVTSWNRLAAFQQVTPPSDGEVNDLLNSFLEARMAGAGALDYMFHDVAEDDIPLLYETTTGTPYDRSEFEVVDGPEWPDGSTQFKVRLTSADGTVVEQFFSLQREGIDRIGLEYASEVVGPAGPMPGTTENGQPVADLYGFFNGEVIVHAAYPWAESFAIHVGLAFDSEWLESIELLSDPLPVGSGCESGPAEADAQALAEAIRSDPDLVATAPVTVSLGGTDAIRMDVTAAAGASVCASWPGTQVLTPDDNDRVAGLTLQGGPMRLYLLDAPEGLSMRVLAIAVNAPQGRFDAVLEAATPVLDSIEFRTP